VIRGEMWGYCDNVEFPGIRFERGGSTWYSKAMFSCEKKKSNSRGNPDNDTISGCLYSSNNSSIINKNYEFTLYLLLETGF
jgi:hypothetical protein